MGMVNIVEDWDEREAMMAPLKLRGREVIEQASRAEGEATAARARAAERLAQAKDCERRAFQALEQAWRHETRGETEAAADHRRTYERRWALVTMNCEAARAETDLATLLDKKYFELRAEATQIGEKLLALGASRLA